MIIENNKANYTLKDIREDLKEIRYYYSRKAFLDAVAINHAENVIVQKVQKYDSVMSLAPIRLYDLYANLYLGNHTQASLSDKWGYSPENIKYLNDKLCKYLQSAL